MKVRENSWHIKINRFWAGPTYTPKNLCSYFWNTVASVLVFPLIIFIVIGAILAGVVGGIAGIVIAFLSFPIWKILLGIVIALGIGVGFLVACFVFIGLGIGLVSLLSLLPWHKLSKLKKSSKQLKSQKEAGLVVSFLKAKKTKGLSND